MTNEASLREMASLLDPVAASAAALIERVRRRGHARAPKYVNHGAKHEANTPPALILSSLYLGVSNLDGAVDELRINSVDGEKVAVDQLLHRAEVVLRLSQLLLDRLGHESLPSDPDCDATDLTGGPQAAHRLSGDPK